MVLRGSRRILTRDLDRGGTINTALLRSTSGKASRRQGGRGEEGGGRGERQDDWRFQKRMGGPNITDTAKYTAAVEQRSRAFLRPVESTFRHCCAGAADLVPYLSHKLARWNDEPCSPRQLSQPRPSHTPPPSYHQILTDDDASSPFFILTSARRR